MSRSLKFSIRIKVKHLAALFELRNELRKELQVLSCKERYRAAVKAKKSVPGIGWLTAIRLTLEWGNMSRFASGKHIASFVQDTGKSIDVSDEGVQRPGPCLKKRWRVC